jgi:hemerythrin-like domain-containing protein
MHTLLHELHKDHINLASLLNILTAQVDVLAAGDDADLWLMAEIADYIGRYADAVHHPREDHIYQVLAGYEAANETLTTLLAQHQTLPTITRDFKNLLKQVLNDTAIISLSELASNIRDFIAIQKAHIDLEEATIFPLIQTTLTAKDWLAIEQSLQAVVDPLFGVKALGRYDNIYNVLYVKAAA